MSDVIRYLWSMRIVLLIMFCAPLAGIMFAGGHFLVGVFLMPGVPFFFYLSLVTRGVDE